MILDLPRFVAKHQPQWRELEAMLKRMDDDPTLKLDLAGSRRFYHLYLKAGADLGRVQSQSVAPQLKSYLEALVSRAYPEIYENRKIEKSSSIRKFYLDILPNTFRRNSGAFWLAVIITLVGALVGGALLYWDKEAKTVLLPFDHLHGTPHERVAAEESGATRTLDQPKGYFASYLMTNNIRVSILTLVLGYAWGAGTLLLLFYNGVILGAVAYDYVADGQTIFLLGWLLPHGVIEIPAIFLAGQAGFIIGAKVIKGRSGPWGLSLSTSFQNAAPDVAVLMGGIATMLVWAGIIEAFFSQYHAPILPYSLKIAFGCLELAGLALYLTYVGRRKSAAHDA